MSTFIILFCCPLALFNPQDVNSVIWCPDLGKLPKCGLISILQYAGLISYFFQHPFYTSTILTVHNSALWERVYASVYYQSYDFPVLGYGKCVCLAYILSILSCKLASAKNHEPFVPLILQSCLEDLCFFRSKFLKVFRHHCSQHCNTLAFRSLNCIFKRDLMP